MPWKLGDPNEPTEKLEVRIPASMKAWLMARRGGASAYIRKLVEAKMARRGTDKIPSE